MNIRLALFIVFCLFAINGYSQFSGWTYRSETGKIYHSETAQSSTFKPTSATIKDSQGSYTSQQFNCPNMEVSDKGNRVQISFGGNSMTLDASPFNNDTYISSKRHRNTEVRIMAYRSSSSGNIYMIVMTTKAESDCVTINFKP